MAGRTKTGYIRIMVYLPPSMEEDWEDTKAELASDGIVKDSDIVTYLVAQQIKHRKGGATLEQVSETLREVLGRLDRLQTT